MSVGDAWRESIKRRSETSNRSGAIGHARWMRPTWPIVAERHEPCGCSAIAALDECRARSAQSTCPARFERGENGKMGVEVQYFTCRGCSACVGLAEVQPVNEPAAGIASQDGSTEPVGCRQIAKVSVNRGARCRAMMIFVARFGNSDVVDQRNVPVPMQHCHVIVAIG